MEEKIKVGVLFKEGKIIPVWFVYRYRKYSISKINYQWCTNRGEAKIYHFSVSDGTNLYEICFNSKNMEWKLRGIS
jgi:hypothetical protein